MRAASSSHVSSFHNQIGQRVGDSNTVILDSKIINENALLNSTYVNEDLRKILSTEIFLDSFIIFGRNIQCLQTTKLVLNNIPTICEVMEVITLMSGFEIVANGKTLTDFHLNAKRNKRLKW